VKALKNKIVLITGAASGIGQATAIEFAGQGADLAVSDINEPALAETIAAIKAKGTRAIGIHTDVSRPEEVEAMVNRTVEEYGRIDILMNNAGVAVAGEMRHLALKDWEWIMGINLWGPIYGVHYALPYMIKQGGGHIINVASSAGLIASPGMSAYTTTKFGLVGLSEVLCNEVRRHKIGVTVVCPGFVRTPIFGKTEVRGMKDDDEARKVPPLIGISQETCARNIVDAVRKNKFLIIPGPEMKLMYGCKRYAPAVYKGFIRMMGWHFKRISVD